MGNGPPPAPQRPPPDRATASSSSGSLLRRMGGIAANTAQADEDLPPPSSIKAKAGPSLASRLGRGSAPAPAASSAHKPAHKPQHGATRAPAASGSSGGSLLGRLSGTPPGSSKPSAPSRPSAGSSTANSHLGPPLNAPSGPRSMASRQSLAQRLSGSHSRSSSPETRRPVQSTSNGAPRPKGPERSLSGRFDQPSTLSGFAESASESSTPQKGGAAPSLADRISAADAAAPVDPVLEIPRPAPSLVARISAANTAQAPPPAPARAPPPAAANAPPPPATYAPPPPPSYARPAPANAPPPAPAYAPPPPPAYAPPPPHAPAAAPAPAPVTAPAPASAASALPPFSAALAPPVTEAGTPPIPPARTLAASPPPRPASAFAAAPPPGSPVRASRPPATLPPSPPRAPPSLAGRERVNPESRDPAQAHDDGRSRAPVPDPQRKREELDAELDRLARERAREEERQREEEERRRADAREREVRKRDERRRVDDRADGARERDDWRRVEERERDERQRRRETSGSGRKVREARYRPEDRERDERRCSMEKEREKEREARYRAEDKEREAREHEREGRRRAEELDRLTRERDERQRAEDKERAARSQREALDADLEAIVRAREERQREEEAQYAQEREEEMRRAIEEKQRRAGELETVGDGLGEQAMGADGDPVAARHEQGMELGERPPFNEEDAELVDAGAVLDEGDEEFVDEDDEEETSALARAVSKRAGTWETEVPPLQERTTYNWTKPTHAPALAALISDRVAVFEKQRAFNDPELQRKSQELIAAQLATYAQSGSSHYSTQGYRVGHYVSFCHSVLVPAWPLTPPLLALFLHALDPTARYAQSTRSVILGIMAVCTKVCRDLWSALPGYEELLAWPGAEEAIAEWKKQPSTGPTAQSKERTRKAPKASLAVDDDGAPESVDVSGDEHDGEPSAGSARYDKLVDYARDCAVQIWQYPTPGIPAYAQTFASYQAAYEAVAAAVIPIYGIGVVSTNPSWIRCNKRLSGCPFRIHLEKLPDEQVRVTDFSIYEHNHDRNPKIVEDPSWRPYIRNAAAREAVQKRDEKCVRTTLNSSKKRSGSPAAASPSPKKQLRRLPSVAKSDKSPSTSTSKLPEASEAPPRARSSGSSTRKSPFKAAVPAPAAATPAPAPAPHPARHVRFSSAFASPAPDPAAFLPDLTAFLTALDPSLAPLAAPLHQAGIASVRDLRVFAQLEPDSRAALYEDVQLGGGDAAMLDVEQIDRLEEALAAARAAGWR
ncbi:hypothetical protein JCM10450v2_002019 [Rhodotorula kratochvilovae]